MVQPPSVPAAAEPVPAGRPAVSVVVPFAGSAEAALRTRDAFAALQARLRPGDELILADNTCAGVAGPALADSGWRVVPAPGEGSPARARNAGADAATCDWLLFVDSDCRPEPDLLDRYFAAPVDERCGLVAGLVVDAPGTGVAARWAASRGLLDQELSLASAAGAWAHTANLLVRAAVWRGLGGFLDGIRNAEDVDLCWRAQERGWTLALCPTAVVAHEHRATVRGLWRQRALQVTSAVWVHRRWPQRPAPGGAPLRDIARALVGVPGFAARGQIERARMKAIDGVVATAEIAGRWGTNRAGAWPRERPVTRRPVELWCDQFPVVSETFVVGEARELDRLGHDVTVVAVRRPDAPAVGVHDVPARWFEDDTRLERARATGWLVARHPLRVVGDVVARRRWRAEEPVVPLRILAPAVRRLHRRPDALVHAHFAGSMALSAQRASRLAGRPWSLTAHAYDIYLMPRNLREKLRSAALVTSGCDYTVEDLRRIAGADRADRVHRIVMGVDPDRFRRQTPHAPGRTVLAVGRMVTKKGFADLVRAAAEPALRDVGATVRIVGDGPLRPELEEEIARLGLADVVTLVGRLEAPAIRAELESAAVLAMPCVVAPDGDRDSMPVVVKEALAMEVPVVATDEVGLPELVRPDFGRLVPPHDPAALAAALAQLLVLDVEQRAAMGRAGRAHVGAYANVATETARLSDLLAALR